MNISLSINEIPEDLRKYFRRRREPWIHRMSIIWHKEGAFPQPHGDKFTRNFENILVFTKNKQYYFKQLFEPFTDPKWAANHPDKPGRNMRSVWEFTPDENDIWTINNNAAGKKHHATYPEELVRRAIEFGCPEGGVVLDPFFGSGTTGIVAEKMGRSWIGIELNEEYCKVAIERINNEKK
jgi:site-specific DNA-methyltransferase (adenine-specific)